jgi:hypothetical protein
MRKLFFLAYIFGILFIFSCHPESDLGYNILPDDDKIKPQITDTFSIKVYTVPEDTISSNYVSTLLLGEYTDPVFGYTKAGFVSQYGLSNSPNFETDHVGDSVILTLTLDTNEVNYYGNISIPQTFKIYKLPNNFDTDTTYYSNQDPSIFTGDLIGEFEYQFSHNIDTFQIPLNASLAQEFIDADEEIYSSTASFTDFFKGIYVTSECLDGNGAILKFKVTANSTISIFYHDNDTEQDTLEYKIYSNLTTVKKFNLFEHDYSETTFFDNIGNESSPQDSVAYIQSMGGLRAKVVIPFLENLKTLGNIAIYRAELIVKTAPSSLTYENEYSAIQNMLVAGKENNDDYYLLPEYYYGNSYLPVAYEDDEYKFEIAGYIRDVLEGNTENNGLFLFTYAGSDNYNRSVISTGSHSDKMKLIITYAKL